MGQSDEAEQAVGQAANGLKTSWHDMAGSEALIRALIAERSQRTNEALFWIRVYRALSSEDIDTIPPFLR
ncbi:hypothetical protein PY650_32205 [Rhizobium calliandrae]|uniref:Uncharacterized protein n=1 Tax=Rhizobium calliandrae TaxID=1312182 RepID=A0ABT7KS06_9HYPH|nr:hypothetical protein [Rhizobium calliandrae]MDL2410194.1 hypothetical protein [Rhizobium calliandrae]